jgi:hypothetical protein
VDKEVVDEEFNDIAGDAEFFRDELIPNSLEFYLDIMASEADDDIEEDEEGEEDTDENTKQSANAAKKEKKVNKFSFFLLFYLINFFIIIFF